MIEPTELLMSGTERDVYLHPRRRDRVIKVGRPSSHVDRNMVEFKFYQTVNPQTKGPVPKLYGWIDTSKGRGLEYELIAEADGTPSLRLLDAVRSGVLHPREAEALLLDFFSIALKNGLIIYDENLGNILYQAHTSSLFLVDGFGPRTWTLKNALRSKHPFLARKKTRQCKASAMQFWHDWNARMAPSLPFIAIDDA